MSKHGLDMAMSRVPREFLTDPSVKEIAHQLHVHLPQGEAHNNVVIAEHIVREDDERSVEGLGMAVLTRGSSASKGEVVLAVDPSLNGESGRVVEALTDYIGRIAKENGMFSLDIAGVQRQQVAVVRDGRNTGQQMNVYRPVYLRTVKL